MDCHIHSPKLNTYSIDSNILNILLTIRIFIFPHQSCILAVGGTEDRIIPADNEAG